MIGMFAVIAQAETTFREPGYFAPVMLGLLVLGAVAWLIAAVLGFARARLWPISQMVFICCRLSDLVSPAVHCAWFQFAD